MDRRSLLAGILAGVASPAFGNPPSRSTRPSLRPDWVQSRARAANPAAIIARSGVSGKVACALADAETGEMLHTTLPVLPLPPASVAKSLTAMYALDRLGPNFRFETRVLAAGSVSGGRLQGDLVLLGGGDPTLDTDALAGLAGQVRAAGILQVTGKLLIWSGALPAIDQIDPSQPVHVGYNPSISGLNLNFNRVYFEWKPAGGDYAISMDARSERLRPAVDVVRMQLANRNLPVYTHRLRNGREEWSVARSALGNGGGRWLPVRQPALYVGDVMEALLAAQGVRLGGVQVVRTPPRGQVIAQHRSVPLPEILRGMLKYSTNLTAEAVGLAASQTFENKPRHLAGSAQSMNAWLAAATSARHPKLRDHSGLDARSELTVTDMVRTLTSPRARSGLLPLLKTIKPTDAALAAGAHPQMRVRAKTGTLNFVSTLSGYLDVPGQRTLAFAIFCADLPRRSSLSRAQSERPPGGREWRRRAKALQMALLAQWAQPRG